MSVMQTAQQGLFAVVAVAGLFKCFTLASALVRFCWRHFLRPPKSLQAYGRWAVVTGATDGIGREYCNALAKQGLNIYLISRTESKLAAAADEIKSAYKVETKYFVADLTAAGESNDAGACWYGLKSNLEGIDVGVLINNAGMSYDHPEFLASLDLATVGSIVAINASSLTKMAQVILPGMKERGAGCIVNISSGVSSVLPACPLLTVYAASKAYVDTFSQSLHAESAHFGIHVQAQSPAFVATKMAKMRRTSLLVPSAKTWVTAAMKHIGYEPAAVPYWPHALLTCSFKLLPASVVVPYWFNMMSKMRARALKKKTAAAKAS